MTHHLKRMAPCAFLCLGTVVTAAAKNPPVDLQLPLDVPFHLVAYGDTRFTDPSDRKASNAAVRRALVQAIDAEHPAFVSITGDISFHGDNGRDWKVWDEETAIWRQHKISVFPTLGNHDLTGNLPLALENYFARFPELKGSRYYSVSVGNILMLVLDRSLDELTGAQGQWLKSKLDHLPPTVEFVFFVLHHPPYTSLSSLHFFLPGHAMRPSEMALAEALETRQQFTHACFVVFSGHVHNYERHEHNGRHLFRYRRRGRIRLPYTAGFRRSLPGPPHQLPLPSGGSGSRKIASHHEADGIFRPDSHVHRAGLCNYHGANGPRLASFPGCPTHLAFRS